MNTLQTFIQSKPCGFLKSTDIPELIKLDRLFPVLVRCGSCRFTCAAQDVNHLIACISAGGDYVRDVSFPVGSFERAATWTPANDMPKISHQASNTKAVGLLAQVSNKSTGRGPTNYHFNESDCGGVFDGSRVISDADPGL